MTGKECAKHLLKEGKSLASLAMNLLVQSKKSKGPTALILQ